METTPNDTTVKGHFNVLSDRYTSEIVRGDLPSTDAALRHLVCSTIVECEELWKRLSSAGVFSANDECDDYSTTALELLWTPYMIADLYQRVQGSEAGAVALGTGAASSSSGARMQGEHEQIARDAAVFHSNEGNGSGGAEAAAYAALMASRGKAVESLTRQEALARSHEWFKIFFEWMQNIELVDEKTIELYSVYRGNQRKQRIELACETRVLEQQWRQYEGKVFYMRAKRRRMQALMEENGDAIEETGGEEEEVLRDRALARLKWSIFDAFHQLQLSSRELEMLKAVNPEQRATISAEYQATMDAVRRGELSLGRQSYTILPGGKMTVGTLKDPQAVDAGMIERSGGISAQVVQAAMAGQHHQFRQQVRDDLMKDFNSPTMTLQEFADMEMAEIQRQTNEAAKLQQERQEEDERLGKDGVEDRQRKKDSAWDDWKDEHPAYGITNKGNYS